MQDSSVEGLDKSATVKDESQSSLIQYSYVTCLHIFHCFSQQKNQT